MEQEDRISVVANAAEAFHGCVHPHGVTLARTFIDVELPSASSLPCGISRSIWGEVTIRWDRTQILKGVKKRTEKRAISNNW